MTEPTTHALDVPGARIAYDVRGDLADRGAAGAVLLLIASPMDAVGFGSLAAQFTDRAVVTYDPRGVARSTRTDGSGELSPDDHAADLHRLVEALGVGPVDVFASSGGAVNGLAWVAAHPQDVRTLVAHEPPIFDVLPDRVAALSVVEDIHDTYLRSGMGPAMAKFIAIVGHQGEIPADHTARPAPDPAAFGLPTEDNGSRGDALLGQNLRGCTGYWPDFAVVAAAPTRVVIAGGESSTGEPAGRAAAGVAERLGTEVTSFPGDHAGFLGGEYGMHGEPEAFAARLREVLAEY